jgi:hypothetical protein
MQRSSCIDTSVRGFYESVYEPVLIYELRKRHLTTRR